DKTRPAKNNKKNIININPPSARLAILNIANTRLSIIITILAIGNISQNFPLLIKYSTARPTIASIKSNIKRMEPKPSLFRLL
ncbi:MAG: hypothetical protein M1479_00005, partial [Actinobacteria bacterium]|nr:hypothetical protein [Actinomycetota bacterium]